MARIPFNLPDIGEGVTEAEIAEWHVEAGDAVVEGQSIATVMTDKANVELEAPATGTVTERHGDVGETLAVGQLLVAIETDAPEVAPPAHVEPVAAPAPSPVSGPVPPPAAASHAGQGKVLASPAVRKRARSLGIDLATVFPGREQIHHSDLDAYLLQGQGVGGTPLRTGPQERQIPLQGLRRQIALKMAESHQHIPAFTYAEEIDVTDLLILRDDLNQARGEKPMLHMLPFLSLALRRALVEFPMLNAHFDDEAGVITQFAQLHLGIAVQTPSGLMAPVVHDAGALDIWGFASAILRLSGEARSGKLSREELQGATITITSLGKLGGIMATPIISRPQVAILAPGRVIERAVPCGERIERRQRMNLSISCDHRIIDGQDAAAFVHAIKRRLETPALLFLDE